MDEKAEIDPNLMGETVVIVQSPKDVNDETDRNHVIEDVSDRTREDANAHNQGKDSAHEVLLEEQIAQGDPTPETGVEREATHEKEVAVIHETEETREIGEVTQGKDPITATR